MSAFTISRSTTVAAPPGVVRGHVEDFRKWRDWSPWEDVDPGLARSYTGPMKVFARFYGIEKLVGPDFEKGLTRLTALAESNQ